jgi:hypothetical protein
MREVSHKYANHAHQVNERKEKANTIIHFAYSLRPYNHNIVVNGSFFLFSFYRLTSIRLRLISNEAKPITNVYLCALTCAYNGTPWTTKKKIIDDSIRFDDLFFKVRFLKEKEKRNKN